MRTGEGRLLENFLSEPVHTGPDRSFAPTHGLPRWMHDAVEAQVVHAGRHHKAYTIELVGIGEPTVSWVLQRLLSRRTMRYQQSGPLHGLEPSQLRAHAEHFQVAYWRQDIHFVLRLNGFDSEDTLAAWVRQHPPREGRPIDRLLPPLVSHPADGAQATAWFEAMGAYAPPCALNLDDDAAAFAFRTLSNWQRLKAYWNRGPDNAIVNILNWPREAYQLTWDKCPQGTVLTQFTCDLRFEMYG